MIQSKFDTLQVEKITPVTGAFSYESNIDQTFPALPDSAVVIDDVLVDRYDGLDQRAFQHHSTFLRNNTKLYCAYTVHDYDEDSSGMYVNLKYSLDDGNNWIQLGIPLPSMSVMAEHDTFPAQWGYPSMFLKIPSGNYLLITTVDGLSNAENYNPSGTMVVKINDNNTIDSPLWVHNGSDDNSRIPTDPIDGFPSYNFASETLISEVKTYISQDMYRPKILFGWQSVWSAQENLISDSNVKLREPTEIFPYGYQQGVKCWKSFQVNFNIFQVVGDNSTQIITNIPDQNPAARRWRVITPEIIVSLGNSANSTRTELALGIWRKDPITNIFRLKTDDIYSLTTISKSTPVYAGFAKNGGEQLPFMEKYGDYGLDISFGVSKEEIYYKRIDISSLI